MLRGFGARSRRRFRWHRAGRGVGGGDPRGERTPKTRHWGIVVSGGARQPPSGGMHPSHRWRGAAPMEGNTYGVPIRYSFLYRAGLHAVDQDGRSVSILARL